MRLTECVPIGQRGEQNNVEAGSIERLGKGDFRDLQLAVSIR
jgi:hypothetical protein